MPGHADGVCHVYVDKSADADKAASVVAQPECSLAAAPAARRRHRSGRAVNLVPGGRFGPKRVNKGCSARKHY